MRGSRAGSVEGEHTIPRQLPASCRFTRTSFTSSSNRPASEVRCHRLTRPQLLLRFGRDAAARSGIMIVNQLPNRESGPCSSSVREQDAAVGDVDRNGILLMPPDGSRRLRRSHHPECLVSGGFEAQADGSQLQFLNGLIRQPKSQAVDHCSLALPPNVGIWPRLERRGNLTLNESASRDSQLGNSKEGDDWWKIAKSLRCLQFFELRSGGRHLLWLTLN